MSKSLIELLHMVSQALEVMLLYFSFQFCINLHIKFIFCGCERACSTEIVKGGKIAKQSQNCRIS